MARFGDRLVAPWRLAAGATAGAVTVIAGAEPAVAAIAAVGVYGVTVALGAGAGRHSREPAIDAFTLSEPWRRYVHAAQLARTRFEEVVRSCRPGPIRDRLGVIATRLDDGVKQCWMIARRGDAIDHAVARLDVPAMRARLAALESASDDAGEIAPIAASLRAQLETADRLKATSARAASQLSLTQVRLDELVARAAEVGIGTSDEAEFRTDVDELVHELESLRLALDVTDAPGLGPGNPPGS